MAHEGIVSLGVAEINPDIHPLHPGIHLLDPVIDLVKKRCDCIHPYKSSFLINVLCYNLVMTLDCISHFLTGNGNVSSRVSNAFELTKTSRLHNDVSVRRHLINVNDTGRNTGVGFSVPQTSKSKNISHRNNPECGMSRN